MDKLRIDKWLWAARFFKTRSLAKNAVEGGKVHLNGNRLKPSKDIEIGAILTIRRGYDELEVEVIALNDKRQGAPQAALLYNETQQSITKRETYAAQRKAMGQAVIKPHSKPNSKQRRQLQDVKRLLIDN